MTISSNIEENLAVLNLFRNVISHLAQRRPFERTKCKYKQFIELGKMKVVKKKMQWLNQFSTNEFHYVCEISEISEIYKILALYTDPKT